MGRDNNHDPTVVHHSSIALLQERFKQLQRVKEMREERELRKMLNEPKQLFNSSSNIPTASSYEPTKLFSQHELITPSSSRSPPPPHVSLSLWPTSQVNNQEEDRRSFQNPVVPMDLCSSYSHAQSQWKNVYDWDSGSDSGVDTSLHL